MSQIPTHDRLRATTPEAIHRARLVVCAHADGPADAALLLTMLGLSA